MSVQGTSRASAPFQQTLTAAATDGHISGKELKQLKSMLAQERLNEPERAALTQILDQARDASKGFLFFRGSINADELNQLKQLAAGQRPGTPAAQFVSTLESSVAASARPSSSFEPVSPQASFPARASRSRGGNPASSAMGQRLAQASTNILSNPHMQSYLKGKGVKPVLDANGQLVNYRKPDGSMMSYCAAGVENTLKQVFGGGFRLNGHAYQMGNQLASKTHPNGRPMFSEMPGLKPPYSNEQAHQLMRSLPAGAVVVWDRSGGNSPGGKYGHIAIALGDGRESSDRIRDHFAVTGGACRIFLPQEP